MSIKQERVKAILNNIIRESILNGEFPTEKNVVNKFRAYLLQYDPSKPYFTTNHVVRGSDLVYEQVNNSFDELYEDLSVLYKRCLELNKDMMSNYILVEKLKTAVDNELKKLEEEVKSLIILNNSPTYLNCAYDSFTDLSKIDTANSNADIDIQKNKVSIDYNKNKVMRIIQKPTITVSYPEYMKPLSDKTEGNVFNMYDDYENTIYTRRVTMDNSEGCIMEILYDFGNKPVSPNKLSFHVATAKPIFCRVMYSPDNINIFDLPHNEDFIQLTGSDVEVNFPQIVCKQIKFIFIKNEHDSEVKTNGTTNYIYDFSFKQLALFDMEHGDTAYIQSLPLDPVKTIEGFTVGKVSLQVDEEKPDETDIEYFVALEPDANEEIDWARISPINQEKSIYPSFIDFMNRSTVSGKIVDLKPTLAEHELVNLNTNGIKMYSLMSITDNVLQSIVYKGVNSALVKMAVTAPTGNIPEIGEFSEDSYEYYSINNGSILYEKTFSTPEIVQISVNFQNKTANNSLSLRPNITTSSVIYLNGRVIMRGDKINPQNSSNFALKTGMNNITIMSYIPANTAYTANIGTNLINSFGEVYAHDSAMTLVDIFDLQNTVLSNDHSKYALYTVNGKTHFVVNDEEQAVKYKINYDYSSSEKSNKLLFKAVLTRKPYANTTPVLYRYVIYCE